MVSPIPSILRKRVTTILGYTCFQGEEVKSDLRVEKSHDIREIDISDYLCLEVEIRAGICVMPKRLIREKLLLPSPALQPHTVKTIHDYT